ncbi:MAG: chorismate mutase [Bdellovibrionales bacterium]|nr:chorismate mutase [Bdellovibrionales bacterium]
MNELEILRKEIDKVNTELALILEYRLQLVEQVFTLKDSLELHRYDPAREEIMFGQIEERFKGSPYQAKILAMFKDIVEKSK